jgi:hypothetical protein
MKKIKLGVFSHHMSKNYIPLTPNKNFSFVRRVCWDFLYGYFVSIGIFFNIYNKMCEVGRYLPENKPPLFLHIFSCKSIYMIWFNPSWFS